MPIGRSSREGNTPDSIGWLTPPGALVLAWSTSVQRASVVYDSATWRRRLWIVSARLPVRTWLGRTALVESGDISDTSSW